MGITLANAAGELAELLQRMLVEGGDGNYLVVSADDAYAQFAAGNGEDEIYCETVANRYLPPERRLGEAQIWRLQQLGFATPSDAGNFHRSVPASDSAERLARQTVAILVEIYGCDPGADTQLDLALQDVQQPDNSELAAALEEAAVQRSQADWDRLFVALLGAEFLVPIVEAEAESEAAEPELVVGPDGEHVLPLFTDMDAVQRMERDSVSLTIVPAGQVFAWAAGTGVTQIVVNPAGPVPGHLDAEGIAALARAAEASAGPRG